MSPKTALHQAIDTLSESECERILMLLNTWHHIVAPRLEQLAENPTFRTPSQGLPVFAPVLPVSGTGSDASTQLIGDRR
jgi:hypothetical protein